VTRVRPTESTHIKQDIQGLLGVNGVTTPSKHLSLLVTRVGPGEASNAHYHVDHESALYCIEGSMQMFWGAELEHDTILNEGDFLFIPPHCPHKTFNRSRTENVAAVTARDDPFEQEQVVPTPELEDGRCEARISYID
jgi:uncharacterized RmlC-like cupin family protein